MKRNNKLFWVFFVIFLGAVCFGIYYYTSQQKKEAVYEKMAEQNQVKEEPEQEEEPPKVETPPPAEEEKPEIPIDFPGLQSTNPEIYAWIRIPDTEVDYPVVQRPEDDTYYLNHTVEGAEGLPGSIFTESLNKRDFTDPNTVIYGHDMRDGTMFGHLKKYMDSTYMEEHPLIYIYTPEHIYTYQVFAAVTYDNRHILRSFDFTQETQFQEFLDSLRDARSMASYVRDDISVSAENRILTLSTCNGNVQQRFLVEAVLTDEQ